MWQPYFMGLSHLKYKNGAVTIMTVNWYKEVCDLPSHRLKDRSQTSLYLLYLWCNSPNIDLSVISHTKTKNMNRALFITFYICNRNVFIS